MTTFTLTSRVNTSIFDVLGIEAKDAGGISLAPVEGIPLYAILELKNISQNTKMFLNRTSIKYDFVVRSIYLGDKGQAQAQDVLTLSIYQKDKTTKVGALTVPANTLDAGLGLLEKPYVVSADYEIEIDTGFAIDTLTFVVQPCVVIEKVNVG